MDIKNIIKVINESRSLLQAIEKLGLSISGTSYDKLRKVIKDNDVSITHFLSSSEILSETNQKRGIPIEEILVEKSNYRNRASLKRRLVGEGLMEYICSTNTCHNTGEWMGRKMSLILDHINGVNDDNRIENLRLLCPNCNATLDTHCGKNKK